MRNFRASVRVSVFALSLAAACAGVMGAQEQPPAPVERQQPQDAYPAAQPPQSYPATQPAPQNYPGPPQSYPPPPMPEAGPAPQPPGAAEAMAGLTSQPASHLAFTFDRDMLRSMLGDKPVGLNSVTVTNYRYQEPAFYVPEALSALRHAYLAAGWKHLVDAHATPREEASPAKPITDLWLHYRGTEIDHVTILIRAPKQMNLIEVSGLLRPLDLLHLGGHFGIPKVDPEAVMVPAPPGR